MKKFDLNKWIYGIIVVVILFYLLADLIPEVQDAGDAINSSDLDGYTNTTDDRIPLAGLFSSSGVIIVLIMAGILISIVRQYLKK